MPARLIPESKQRIQFPANLFGRSYIKRIKGHRGLFSCALVSGRTTSIGSSDYPVDSISDHNWFKAESPVRLIETSAENLFVIFQLKGGPAEIVIDDVSIHAKKDNLYLWDATLVRQYFPELFRKSLGNTTPGINP